MKTTSATSTGKSIWKSIRLLWLGGAIALGIALATPPISAQVPASSTALLKGAWQRVYDQLPTLPKANQYIDLKTKTVNPSNTLASRMIKYHIFVKGRAPNSRLDWKLTVADYLGINEIMYEGRYPGIDELKINPYESDLALIRALNRSQRNALEQAMVNAFTPQNTAQPTAAQPPASTVPSTAAPQPTSDRLPPSPKAGDANLLRF